MENIKMPLRVLILEDRPEDAELMLYELRKSGFQPEAHSARALTRAAGRTRRLLAVTLETARKNNYKSEGIS